MQLDIHTILESIERVIVGKHSQTKLCVAALLAQGHILIEDAPGLGKTLLAKSIAASIGGAFKRIQCTPDLLPSDITGVSIYEEERGSFVFHPGPIFANIVLVDEINRATPRTQSSLLEAMAENQVSVDMITHKLPRPYLVIATQNPIEYHGTYPLPEAQLDRFMIRLEMGHPNRNEMIDILKSNRQESPLEQLTNCIEPNKVTALQQQVLRTYIDDKLLSYIAILTEATRLHDDVELGASPRAAVALMQMARAMAVIERRDYVDPDSIKTLAPHVLAHRLVLKSTSDYRSAHRLVAKILDSIPVPVIS